MNKRLRSLLHAFVLMGISTTISFAQEPRLADALELAEAPEYQECPICFEQLRENVVQAEKHGPNCGHRFHDACIHECMQRDHNCPMCRQATLGTLTPIDIAQERAEIARKAQKAIAAHAAQLRAREEFKALPELIRIIRNKQALGPKLNRIQQLFADNVNINVTDADGVSAARWAVMRGQRSILELLLKNKKLLRNALDRWNNNLLHTAVENEKTACITTLLKHRVNPATFNAQGETALHQATRLGFIPGIHALLDSGRIHPDSRNSTGSTALHIAAALGNCQTAEALTAHGALVNVTDRHGKTALHIALENRHPAFVRLLLSNPTTLIDGFDQQNKTPLAYAIATNDYPSVALLCQSNAIIHTIDIAAAKNAGIDPRIAKLLTFKTSRGIKKFLLKILQGPLGYAEVIAAC